MKAWIVRQLRRLLEWLDPPSPPDALARAAHALVRDAHRLPGAPGGEYKRHWVYGRLVKAFPDRPHREIGLAIELAVNVAAESVAGAGGL